MSFDNLFQPLAFARGPQMKNRFMLAPLTNKQSRPDGVLTEDEIHWLSLRAKGGFGLVMTAAAHVQAVGKGFEGQLGVFGDQHLPGLARMAERLRAHGAVCAVQLHHAGNRSPAELVGQPVSASDDPQTGARGLSLDEVEALRDDFIAAAVRAERAGFDGVEIHGAHGYIITQFLSAELNRREDRYGGPLENRTRLLFEIIDGVRAAAGPNFQLGLRITPERFGIELAEAVAMTRRLLAGGQLDYLDLSLWDVFKEPAEEAFQGRTLMSYFTELDRGRTRIGAAGKVMTPDQAAAVISAGCDYVSLGRAAILHHDYPDRLRRDDRFRPVATPVAREHLAAEGLSPGFVEYMKSFSGFVAEHVAAE
ncbi:NADH:flavin oxidoreductase [Phenylobacterium sp. LjRoot219]|uniref:NADH:flavin oxidoreductase n=1 Tax=Phenylobacterium sp. LjRoot219 TaxID=3342283 RepID=UPI003ECD7E16